MSEDAEFAVFRRGLRVFCAVDFDDVEGAVGSAADECALSVVRFGGGWGGREG